MLLTPGFCPIPKHPEYELREKLGSGAFGEVWRSTGPDGSDVALKFIPLASLDHIETELRAIEVMRAVRHPNLVPLFGAWYSDRCLILAMELCDRTLADRLAEIRAENSPGIPIGELLGYMTDAAAALDELCSKQVLHRDVKPANLLLLGSKVKVGDFGLAKVLEHTMSNTSAGTLGYMAPECYTGKLTPQSDQYSLAATYYHLRTGQRLFQGSQAEVMYAQLRGSPVLSNLLSEEAAILSRALCLEPNERWQSSSLFVASLAGVLFRELREQDHKSPTRVAAIKEHTRAIQDDTGEEAQSEESTQQTDQRQVSVVSVQADFGSFLGEVIVPRKAPESFLPTDPLPYFKWLKTLAIIFLAVCCIQFVGSKEIQIARTVGGCAFILLLARAVHRVDEINWCAAHKCTFDVLTAARKRAGM